MPSRQAAPCEGEGCSCAGQSRCVTCPVTLCRRAHAALDAVRLTRLGSRAGLTAHLTGLEKSTVNRLHRELLGRPSPPGQAPYNEAWYLRSELRMLQAAVVWGLYRRLKKSGRPSGRLLLDVHTSYLALVQKPVLSLMRVAFVPQLVSAGLWQPAECTLCGTAYLASRSRPSIFCPGCRLLHRFRCLHCGALLKTEPRGRYRKTCARCGTAQRH
jgi:hypothetical protein